MAKFPRKINASVRLQLRLPPGEVRRFMAKVSAEGKCWRWLGWTDTKGYGQFHAGGKSLWAHRAAYAIFRGTIGAGFEIDHACKNPWCVNPWHLRKRTRSANCADTRRPGLTAECPF